LIIMDLMIPGGMGGAEAISLLKEQFPDVKSIVTSGYSNDPILANYTDYGFQGCLPKPYKTEELGKVIHNILLKTSRKDS
jgi:DNA-binding NarL/FixJ family response regulator